MAAMPRHAPLALLLILAAPCAFGDAAPQAPAPTTVPILIYHSVREYLPRDTPTDRQYIITPETLEAELSFLRDRGFVSVSFDQLEAHIRAGAPLPEPAVIISFDDGWESQYLRALPLLRKYGFTATFYIFTNGIDRPHFMTRAQLKELLADGMAIGSHSVSHPYLARIKDPAQLRREIFESKRILEADLGVAVTSFAYPFGHYTKEIVDLIREAGYTSARSTYFGFHHGAEDLLTLTGLIDVTAVKKIDIELLQALGEEEKARAEYPPPGLDPNSRR
jgi:peptidoglycan/xylan/chitin deacetylase (PgdA/CDA1 family)